MKPQSNKNEINTCLNNLKQIIDNSVFDIDRDFTLIYSYKPNDIEHSTRYTMDDLEYTEEDVIEELRSLTLENYSGTLLDQDNPNPPLLYVFGKTINKKQVYIKLKLKGEQRKRILCVSFHYAKEAMLFPYA